MANLTPQEIVEKQKANVKSSLGRMKTGVERVATAPGQKAAAKAQKMLSRLTAVVQDGTWARRVGGISLPDWQRSMIDKGIQRVSAGIDTATPKLIDFHTKLKAYQETLRSQLSSMPDETLEDALARSRFWTEKMAQFKY